MTKYACGLPSCRPASVLLLPSRLAPCHLPQGGRLWFSAQSKLVSPFGRDVAQRQRGLAPSLRELDLPQAKTEGAANYLSRIRLFLAQTCPRAAPSVTAYAVPPSSGMKALVFTHNPTCLSGRAEKPVQTFFLLRAVQLVSLREPRSRSDFFALTHSPNLSLPSGEMSRSDREGLSHLA